MAVTVSWLFGASPTFPPGSQVGIYRRRSFPGPGPLTGQPPGIAPVQNVMVMSNGMVEIDGLDAETPYVAGAEVNGVWRYIGFLTGSPAEAAGVGGGEVFVTTVIADYQAGQAGLLESILVDTTAGDVTIKLKATEFAVGAQITVANIGLTGNHAHVVVEGGGEVILPGEAPVAALLLGAGETLFSATLVPKGGNWYVQ